MCKLQGTYKLKMLASYKVLIYFVPVLLYSYGDEFQSTFTA